MTKQQHHFLIVTYPAQGHITPARHLAHRLVAAAPGGSCVTICPPLSAFRRMFPGAAEEETMMDDDHDTEVAYAAYSDAYDGGFDPATDSYAEYTARSRAEGTCSLATLLRRLRESGRPVMCAVYTLLLPWVVDVARDEGVPSTAVFWIQPATALAAYFHYFRGHRQEVLDAAAGGEEVRLPGLPPMLVQDHLPSFVAIDSDDHPFAFVLPEFAKLVDAIERRNSSSGRSSPATHVLANTFEAMESEALASLRPHVHVFAVGPVLSFLHDDDAKRATAPPPRDLFEHDGEGYHILEWLDSKPARTVVYISFGSSSVMNKDQVAEIVDAMARVKKPFLWVLRKDNCKDKQDDAAIRKLVATAATADDDDKLGLVVAWCDQARVLSHGSVACFLTHCGWNSALEATACGVPVVAVPQYSDQGTAAWLVQDRMGTGVRAATRAGDGGVVVDAAELVRCVDAVTLSEAVAMRAVEWRDRARAAVAQGGSSDQNLRDFLMHIADEGRNN